MLLKDSKTLEWSIFKLWSMVVKHKMGVCTKKAYLDIQLILKIHVFYTISIMLCMSTWEQKIQGIYFILPHFQKEENGPVSFMNQIHTLSPLKNLFKLSHVQNDK